MVIVEIAIPVTNMGRIVDERILMTHVIVVIGAGSIGQAIVRRVGAGKHVLLADLRQETLTRPQRL